MRKILYAVAFILTALTDVEAQNVGIGETSPASKFSVKGNMSVGSGYSGTAAPTNGALIEGRVQVGTTTADNSAVLQIESTNQGVLIPKFSIADASAAAPVSTPATGLLVYNTNASITGGNGVGFYFWAGTAWTKIQDGTSVKVQNGVNLNTTTPNASATTPFVELGGALVRNTSIDQATNSLTIFGGVINLNDNSNNAVNIGTGTSTGTINIGNGNGGQTLNLGNSASGAETVILGGAASTSTTTIQSGTGAVNINASNNQPTNINTGTSTGAVSIGNSTNTVAVSGGTNTITGTTNINASNNSATNIGTGTTTSAVTIGGAANQTIDIGTGAAVKTVTLGSINTTSTTTINSGSGSVNINNGNSQPVNIGTGTNTGAVNIGGTGNTVTLGTDNAGSNVKVPKLTASKPVFTDAFDNLVSTGTLGVDQGGTGTTTLTANGVLLGNTTSAISATAAGTADQILRVPPGAGGAPAFGSIDLSKSAAVGSSLLPIANGGTGAATASANTVFAGPTSGSGAPSFRALTSGDLPSGSSSYIQNGISQQTSSNFNISGSGVVGTSFIVDNTNANTGTVSSALTFGSASGEGIGSKRTASGNQFGLDFYTASSNRMAITNTGSIGIGTTAPTAPLEIIGNSTTPFDVLKVSGSNTIGSALMLTSTATGGRSWDIISTANAAGEGAGKLLFKDMSSSVRMTIAGSSGNVGIGTTSPSTTLHVVGNSTISGNETIGGTLTTGSTANVAGTYPIQNNTTTSGQLLIGSGRNGDPSIKATKASAWTRIGGAAGLSFWADGNSDVNDAPQFHIASAGNVGIGTTTPSSRLDVSESGNNTWGARITQTNATASNGLNIQTQTTNSGDAALQVTSNGGANNCLIVRNNGNVGLGNSSPNSTLTFNGGLQGKVRIITTDAAVTLDNTDFFVLSTNTFTANRTMTLPTLTAGTTDGKVLIIRNGGTTTTSGWNLTAASGNSVSFAGNWANPMYNAEGVILVSRGTVWYMIEF